MGSRECRASSTMIPTSGQPLSRNICKGEGYIHFAQHHCILFQELVAVPGFPVLIGPGAGGSSFNVSLPAPDQARRRAHRVSSRPGQLEPLVWFRGDVYEANGHLRTAGNASAHTPDRQKLPRSDVASPKADRPPIAHHASDKPSWRLHSVMGRCAKAQRPITLNSVSSQRRR